MSKCKSCGAHIIWIQTREGKMMPCDPKPIHYKANHYGGSLSLVTPDGKVERGDICIESEKVGYTSHFATCPDASQHRKGEIHDGQQMRMF